jgi:phosphatidylethanolamine-binding protein (PEBP) family uncharacterized protein
MVSKTAKGLLIMIDPDVNVFGNKGFLHWLSPNVDLSNEKAAVPATGGNMVKYFQPTPAVGDPPHHYTFLLYSQPEKYVAPAKFPSSLGFNVTAFAATAGLGQPKAATFMLVEQKRS